MKKLQKPPCPILRNSKKTQNWFLHSRPIQGVLIIQIHCRRSQERFTIKFKHQNSKNRHLQFHGLAFLFKIVLLDSYAFNTFLWLFCIARNHMKLMAYFNWAITPWIKRCHDQISRVLELWIRAFWTRENWDQWDTWLRSWDQDDQDPYLAKYLYVLWFYSLFFLAGISGG